LGNGLLFFHKSSTLALLNVRVNPGFIGNSVMQHAKNLKLVLAGLCCASALVMSGLAQARTTQFPGVQESVNLLELPQQGQQMYSLIQQGGPFVSEKDGVYFGNRERILPIKTRGYYREYTVPTPGLSHRGVKRIVCGGQPKLPDVCYYTADHYASFRKIVP
jgi:ribonuclease T1